MKRLEKSKVSEVKIERLLMKLLLLKIRKSLIIEEERDYYNDLDNIKERFEISRKNYMEYGCEWLEIEYLIFWKNGYVSFSKMNRTNLKTNTEISLKEPTKKLELCKTISSYSK